VWSNLWKWTILNRLLALTIAASILIALASAGGGISAWQKAKGYLDLAKGWQKAYTRDTAASAERHRREMAVAIDRVNRAEATLNVLRARLKAARTPKANRPTATAKELEGRFRELGYGGTAR